MTSWHSSSQGQCAHPIVIPPSCLGAGNTSLERSSHDWRDFLPHQHKCSSLVCSFNRSPGGQWQGSCLQRMALGRRVQTQKCEGMGSSLLSPTLRANCGCSDGFWKHKGVYVLQCLWLNVVHHLCHPCLALCNFVIRRWSKTHKGSISGQLGSQTWVHTLEMRQVAIWREKPVLQHSWEIPHCPAQDRRYSKKGTHSHQLLTEI